jgi:hypothetical protein
MKKHIGSTLDALFEELGEKEEVDLLTQKKLHPIPWINSARCSPTSTT